MSALTPAAAATPAKAFAAFFFLDGFFLVGFGIEPFALWYLAIPLAALHVAQPSIAFRLVRIFIDLLSSGLRRRPLSRPDVNRTTERDEAGLLDGLGERRVRRHAVRDRLDRCLCIERDDSGLDQIGHVRPDHHEPQKLAAARLVDRLDPAHR